MEVRKLKSLGRWERELESWETETQENHSGLHPAEKITPQLSAPHGLRRITCAVLAKALLAIISNRSKRFINFNKRLLYFYISFPLTFP